MPEFPKGLMLYPGVEQPVRGSFTTSTGAAPGYGTLVFAPPPLGETLNVPPFGDLEFSFGDESWTLPNCAIEDGQLNFAPPTTLSIRILDRRWKWKFATVKGHWNRRLKNGDIDPDYKKTTAELIGLIFDAIGEVPTAVDVPADAAGVGPEVRWDGDSAADALESLCSLKNCLIVPDYVNDSFSIMQEGSGASLPIQWAQANSVGLTRAVVPSAILAESAPIQYQSKLRLRAVMEDVDGKFVRNDDVSYKPADGWKNEDPSSPLESVDTDGNEEAKKRLALAKSSYMRTYKVWSQADGTILPPGYQQDGVPEQSLRINLLGTLAAAVFEDEPANDQADVGEAGKQRKGFIEGVFCVDDWGFVTSEKGTLYDEKKYGGWSLDIATGIVRFSRPVFQINADGEWSEAELYLTVGYTTTDKTLDVPQRASVQRDTGSGSDTKPELVRRDDLVLVVLSSYDDADNPTKVTNTTTNFDDVALALNLAIDDKLAEYTANEAQTVPYAGLIPIAIDGAIRQVTWSFDSVSGARTIASRNTEHRRTQTQRQRQREASARLLAASIEPGKRLFKMLRDRGVPPDQLFIN